MTCSEAIRSSRYCGSRSPPGSATTTQPPDTNGSRISLIEMSKDNGALNNDASPGPKPRISSTCQVSRSQIASCRIIAPFGVPVEPDVKMT